MAASREVKAAGRDASADAAIRACLGDGSGREALNRAIAVLQSEASKERKRRPPAMQLIDAELAGWILAVAAQLRNHKPARPRGCPRFPTPAYMIAAFTASYQQAASDSEPDQ